MNSTPRKGLLLCQDLLFISKVQGAALQQGLTLEAVGDIKKGLTLAASGEFSCLFLDLSLQPLAVQDLTGILTSSPPPPVIAFGAHVNTVRLDEARTAGCREVLSRGQLHAALSEILQRYLG